jgi:hypothetical protein
VVINLTILEIESKEKTTLSKSKTPISSKTINDNIEISTKIDKIELVNEDKQNQFENSKVDIEIEKKDTEEIVQIDSNEVNLLVQEDKLDSNNEALGKLIVNTENEIDLNINIGRS